eukprot:comp23930_c0_seq1/m.42251 comp23930_c0_seq1/g.42251  ORF comp23930_c0_seq1/g.42251 comp23930_c0_seq1/m.42251 type:complete len:353 (-) comp23930_c0_seq1:108-1166(-)
MAAQYCSYTWSQTQDTITLEILSPTKLRKKDIHMEIKQKTMVASFKNGTVAVKGTFFNLIDSDSSAWTTEAHKEGTLIEVTLIKVFPGSWPCVMKEGMGGSNELDPTSQYYLGAHLDAQRDYAGALTHFQQAAAQGQPDALCKLGFIHRVGPDSHYPVKKDEKEALRLYQQAADQGRASGWLQLGNMHHRGWGTQKDYSQAAECYRKATETATESEKVDAANAHFSLSLLYGEGGPGLERNDKLMVECLVRATALGSAAAHFQLGQLYLKGGDILPKDLGQAKIHFEKARMLDPHLVIPGEASAPLSPRSRKVVDTGYVPKEWTTMDIVTTALTVVGLVGAFYFHYKATTSR